MTPATNNIVAPEVAQDNAAAPDFSGMEKYNPVSRAAALETYVPQSMAYETRQALLRVQMLVGGNVDVYVTQRLKYPDVGTLHSYFSAEQVDALALAIFNIETGEGMVIGDQTGIGKGRIAAGVVRYGCVNGLPTIFITEKPTLFSDFYRDLYDIGSLDLVPLIINTDPAATLQINLDAETIVKVHEHTGNDKYKPKTLLELKGLLGEYTSDDTPMSYRGGDDYEQAPTFLPPGYNFVMATYSQMSDDIVSKQMMKVDGVSVKVPDNPGPSQFKTTFMANYARGAVVVLDEAHNASGGASATGYYIQYGILGRCKGCCYLSATFAKRPDNMGVYATKTAIKHTGLTPIKLAEAFGKGGVALQEIVAAQLVASGQMLRRQRTFEGIEVAYNYLPERYQEHAALYNKVIRLVSAIIEFEREYVAPFLEEMSESLGYGGDKADKTKGTKEGGVNNSPFFNKTHHVIRQLLFSVKAQDVAREALKMLDENLKVVIAFSSTMESFVNELGLTDGDIVENADFSLVLKKSLENALKYTVSSGSTLNGNYQAEHHVLTESDFGFEGAAILAALKVEIDNASTGIMLSPIDTLINEIEKVRKPDYVGGGRQEYYRVRECTGRKGQMKEEDGQLVYRSFKANVKQFFSEFNSGESDVLLINQSASTGVSAHSSAKVKDQRQRAMIIHQPELDINTEVQKRGRINRTGQVNKPKYLYVSSSIPAEKRIFMVLKRKLKSLDANTTGNQRSSQQVLDTEDFFNKYGNKVVRIFLDENISIALALDMASSQKSDDDDRRQSASDDVAETFSRRIALLPVELQETSYQDVTERYGEYVNDLKERGEYDLEVEYLDLQAETMERTVLAMGSGQASAFGRHAVMETVSARVLRRPMKWSEVQNLIEKALNGKTPEALQTEMIFEYESGRAQLFDDRTAKINREIAAIQERLDKPAKKDATEEGIEKLKKKLENLQDEKALLKVKLDGEKNTGKRMLEFYRIGRPFIFKREERQYSAVVTNVYFAKPAGDTNRYNHPNIRISCAVYGPDRSATLKFNDTATVSALVVTESTSSQFLDDMLYNWNRMEVTEGKRERRQVISNNVLLGIAEAPANGKLIKFSQDNGAIRSGILLESERTRSGDTIVEPARTKQPVTGLHDEIMRTNPGAGKRYFVGGNTIKNSISFERAYGNEIHIVVPSTGAYKKFWGDQDLIDLVKENYTGGEKKFSAYTGNLFQARMPEYNLKTFLQILWDKHQITYEGAPIQYNEADDAPLPDNYIEVEVVAAAPAEGGAAGSLIEGEIQQLMDMIELELA